MVILLNIFEGVDINAMQFIGPLIILIVMMFVVGFIYNLFFNWLPKKVFDPLFVTVLLLVAYLWAVPMNLGFYEFFK